MIEFDAKEAHLVIQALANSANLAAIHYQEASKLANALAAMKKQDEDSARMLSHLAEMDKAEKEKLDATVADLSARLANMTSANESLLQTIEAERVQYREKIAELERVIGTLNGQLDREINAHADNVGGLMEKIKRLESDHAETLARVSGDRIKYEDEIKEAKARLVAAEKLAAQHFANALAGANELSTTRKQLNNQLSLAKNETFLISQSFARVRDRVIDALTDGLHELVGSSFSQKNAAKELTDKITAIFAEVIK